jgi:hypothetical protein
LCRNEWIYLATLDPHSDQIHLLRNGRFEPYKPDIDQLPSTESSLAWYRGWRDHLGYALIGASTASAAGQHGA